MTTSQDFDTAYEQLAKGLLENRKASQRLFRSTTEAQQKHKDTLSHAEENYNHASNEAADKLTTIRIALRDAQATIQKARLREQSPRSVATTPTNGNSEPLLGLEQAQKQAQTSLQTVQNAYLELKRIRELQWYRQKARQNVIYSFAVTLVLVCLGMALILAVFFAFTKYTGEKQRNTNMTSTALAIINSTSAQLTNAVNMQATVQQADQYTATAEANMQATVQQADQYTATAEAIIMQATIDKADQNRATSEANMVATIQRGYTATAEARSR